MVLKRMEHNSKGKTGNNNRDDNIVEKLKETLAMRDDIVLAFLFGSYQRGGITSFSDLDIALFFAAPTNFYRINELKEEISKMFGIEADIVVLNNASPVIKMQVLKKGALLINKDRHVYNEFFVKTMNEYDDLKRTRKEIEDNILNGRIYA